MKTVNISFDFGALVLIQNGKCIQLTETDIDELIMVLPEIKMELLKKRKKKE